MRPPAGIITGCRQGVDAFLDADRGSLAVAGVDDGVVGQPKQFPLNAGDEQVGVAAGEVRASDAALEEHVAAKDDDRRAAVHEHHMPETLHDREVGLLKLLEQSYAGWTQARPYPLSSDEEPFSLPPERPCTWEDVARYVDGSGSNSLYCSTSTLARFMYSASSCRVHQSFSAPVASKRRPWSSKPWPISCPITAPMPP